MGRITILLIFTVLVLAMSSYSEAYSGDRFTNVGSLGRLYYVGTKINWMKAKEHCESLGSRLVEIWTDKQYNELNSWVQSRYNPYYYHVGLSDLRKKGHWVWESGHLLDASIAKHWGRGYPSSTAGTDCVYVRPRAYSRYRVGMYDGWCNDRHKMNFVCQKPSRRSGEGAGGVCEQAMAVAVKACSMARSCGRAQR